MCLAHIVYRVSCGADNCPSLFSLNAINNQLSGSLPTFLNTPLITDVYLSYNQFSGSLPLSWGFPLQELARLELAHNQLVSPFGNIVQCQALTYADFSYNQFTSENGDPQFNGNPGALMFSSFPNSIQTIILEHNLLTGTWEAGWTGLKTLLSVFDVSDNQLSGPYVFCVFASDM